MSELKNDNDLLDDICGNGDYDYDGYATDKMKTLLSHFDPEITICKPRENLSKAQRVNKMSEEDIKNANAEARLIEQNKSDRENRKNHDLIIKLQGLLLNLIIIIFLVMMTMMKMIVIMILFLLGWLLAEKRKSVKKKKKSPKFWRDMKPSKKGRKTYKKNTVQDVFYYLVN